MSKAGEILYMTPQAVSRQIKALEKELGFDLLIRHNMGVHLSKGGASLYEVWERLLYEHMRAIDKARDMHYGEQMKLMIGMEDIGNVTFDLMRNLADYNEKNPDLDIHFEIQPTNTMIEYLTQGRLHMVIAFTSEFDGVSGIKKLKIESHPVHVGIILSKYHPLARKKEMKPEHLIGENLGILSTSVSRDYHEKINDMIQREHLKDKVEIKEYDSRQNMELALVSRKCIAVTYDEMFAHQEDKLKFYPLKEYEDLGGISIAWKEDKYEIKARQILEHFAKFKKR